jgi:inosine-uridine nucleoside N-ribohydrolase
MLRGVAASDRFGPSPSSSSSSALLLIVAAADTYRRTSSRTNATLFVATNTAVSLRRAMQNLSAPLCCWSSHDTNVMIEASLRRVERCEGALSGRGGGTSHPSNSVPGITFGMVGAEDRKRPLHCERGVPVAGRGGGAGVAEPLDDMSAPLPLILDCDPGHDDAMALIMAACLKDVVSLELVTTVAGNVPLSSTTRNARRILHACGRPDVLVVPGSERPLLKDPVACHEIHGTSGMDGFDAWPSMADPSPLTGRTMPPDADSSTTPVDAINAMGDCLLRCAEASRASESPMPVLVATGPLTNVALLLRMRPDVVRSKALTHIVLMGGAIGLGNTSPAAEFNIECDPEAAAIVFGAATAGVRVTVVPLEVTHTAIVTEDRVSRLFSCREGRGSPPEGYVWADSSCDAPAMVTSLLKFFEDTYRRVFGFDLGPPVHDPCAVLCAYRPDEFELKRCRVVVETSGVCAGRTVVDLLNVMGGAMGSSKAAEGEGHEVGEASFSGQSQRWREAPLIHIATAMRTDALFEELTRAVEACDRQSPVSLRPS